MCFVEHQVCGIGCILDVFTLVPDMTYVIVVMHSMLGRSPSSICIWQVIDVEWSCGSYDLWLCTAVYDSTMCV